MAADATTWCLQVGCKEASKRSVFEPRRLSDLEIVGCKSAAVNLLMA